MASVTGSQCCWPNVKLFLELFPVPWSVWCHFFFLARFSSCHFFIVVAIMLQVCLLLLPCNLCFTHSLSLCVCCILFFIIVFHLVLVLLLAFRRAWDYNAFDSVYPLRVWVCECVCACVGVWVCVQPQCVQSNQEATGNVLISIVQLPPLRHLPQLAANSIKGLWSLCNHLKVFACEHSHS